MENPVSYNPMSRNPNDFDVKVGSYDAKTFNGIAIYSTKICMRWKVMLEQKAREAGMAVNAYVQKMVEERFSVDTQVELANMHGVTLAQQRRELFMHVWPDLPKWNVWSNRVLVPANAPRRGRPAGGKNTSHDANEAVAVHTPNVEPVRYALNGLVLTPTAYDEVQAMADAKNQSMHQVIQEMLHTWATKRIAAREQTPMEAV